MADFTKKDLVINLGLAAGAGYGLFWVYNYSEFSWFCQDVAKLVSTMIDWLEKAGAAAKKDFGTANKDIKTAVDGTGLSVWQRTKLLGEAFWHLMPAKVFYDEVTA